MSRPTSTRGANKGNKRGRAAVASATFPPAPFAPVLARNTGKIPYSRRMLHRIIPSATAGLFALQFSGEDKYIVGQTSGSANGEQPRQVWNDATGAHSPCTVADNLTQPQADTIVGQLAEWCKRYRFSAEERAAVVTDPLAVQALSAIRSAFPDTEVCTKNFASLDKRRADMSGEKTATAARVAKTATASPSDALLAIARKQATGANGEIDEKRAAQIHAALLSTAGLTSAPPAQTPPANKGKGKKTKAK